MMAAIPVDLFATKGIEYVLVIVYLVALVVVWRLLQWRAPRGRGVGDLASTQSASAVSGFDVRDDLLYHQGHSWVAAGRGHDVAVGMDDFAGQLLGAPDAIDLPRVGTRLREGETAWHVEVDGERIPMLAPVDGEVTAVNVRLQDQPELASREPYENGWLVRVRPERGRRFRANLLSGAVARHWMEDATEQLRRVRSPEVGLALPDGGVPVDGFARALGADDWAKAARTLLLSDDLENGRDVQ